MIDLTPQEQLVIPAPIQCQDTTEEPVQIEQEPQFVTMDQTQQTQEHIVQEPMPLRRSTRERRNAISDDYVTFLQEIEDNGGMTEDDPINFCHAMKGPSSDKWIEAMQEEYKSMQDNKVWELVPIARRCKTRRL